MTEGNGTEADKSGKAGKLVPPTGKAPTDKAPADKSKSTVIGKGWTSVFVARMGTNTAAEAAKSPEAQSFLNQLPAGANGSRFLTSKLFSVLVTSDGRVLIGAVSPERLAQVAADPAAQLK